MIDPDEMVMALRRIAAMAPAAEGGGDGAIAARIRAIAADRGIPVGEDAGLATVLDRLDAESRMPGVCAAASAEILARLLGERP